MKRRFSQQGPDLFESAKMETGLDPQAIQEILAYHAAHEDYRASTGVFDAWVPSILFKGAKPHSVPLVESAALAVIRPPTPSYRPSLPVGLSKSGALSNAQLEAITYAGEAHSGTIHLRDNKWNLRPYRRGFKIGAGMGVGKGRILAGVILDNWNQGRKRALFITENTDLLSVFKNDCAAIGFDPKKVVSLARWRPHEPITLSEGILFCTYAMLRSVRKDATTKEINARRVEQIQAWINMCPDGVIVFDESQNLGNAVPSERSQGWWSKNGEQGSKQGIAALALQTALSNARIVYSSATSDDHLESLAYAPRLGLWGEGTAFATRGHFVKSMNASGITALEIACQHLKARGLYWAPQLSAEGVTTETLTHVLSEKEIANLNGFNRFFRTLDQSIEQALVWTKAAAKVPGRNVLKTLSPGTVSSVRTNFTGTALRFYQLIYMSLKMQTVLAHMHERLNAGEACVVQMHNTFESSQREALKDFNPLTERLDTLDVSPRRVMLDFLRTVFPVAEHKTYRTKRGELRSDVDLDPRTGMITENPKAVQLRDNLIAELESITMPRNPIDVIIDEFGTERVAENTGRRERLVWQDIEGVRTRVIEKRKKSDGNREVAAFMDDRKPILAFSESKGGIGQSYHADAGRANQRKRNHYLLQIPWRAIDALQGLGRTLRTNQVSYPHYILTTTSVPAETRFVSTIAARLGQLGALTRGNREAGGTELIDQSSSLESGYTEAALDQMIVEVGSGMDGGIGPEFFLEQMRIDAREYAKQWAQNQHGSKRNRDRLGDLQPVNVTRFLNRLLLADVAIDGGPQGKILEGLVRRSNDLKAVAMSKGTYDPGLRTISGLTVEAIDESLVSTNLDGGSIRFVDIQRTEAPQNYSFGTAKKKLEYYAKTRAVSANDAGWFLRADGVPEVRIPTYELSVVTAEYVLSPYNHRYVDAGSMPETTKPATEDEAKAAWATALTLPRKSSTERVRLLVGDILPYWNAIRQSMEKTPTIWKAVTDDGKPLIGVRFEGVSTPIDTAAQHLSQRIEQLVATREKEVVAAQRAATQQNNP